MKTLTFDDFAKFTVLFLQRTDIKNSDANNSVKITQTVRGRAISSLRYWRSITQSKTSTLFFSIWNYFCNVKKQFQTFLNRLLDFPWKLIILDSLNRIIAWTTDLAMIWAAMTGAAKVLMTANSTNILRQITLFLFNGRTFFRIGPIQTNMTDYSISPIMFLGLNPDMFRLINDF